MNKSSIDRTRIGKELLLGDGSLLVLLDMLTAPASITDNEVEQNIFKISQSGAVLWQVDAGPGVYARSPFTSVSFNENRQLMGYRWDGTEYKIDIETGKAIPHRLVR